MSKNAADLTPGPARGVATPTPRRQTTARRAPTSARLAREARLQRVWYLALFGVVGLVLLTLIVGALFEYVINPAHPVATVNGVAIRTDSFNRYQGFQKLLLTNQDSQLQSEISQLQANTKAAAANAQVLQQLQQQDSTVQTNLTSNLPAYTLSQMEASLEVQQAAAKIGAGATPAQVNSALATLQKGAGGASGYSHLLSSSGVQEGDLRTYYLPTQVVQQNVTKNVTVSATQPWAKARHILLATTTPSGTPAQQAATKAANARQQELANQLAKAIRSNNGLTFAALAKKYSIDNGGPAPAPYPGETAQQKQQALLQHAQGAQQSSAYNGGWLRDPSQPFAPNAPTWLTPQTGFVAPVLNAALSMKPGEVRVAQSQFGYHIIQVTQTQTHKLTKTEHDNLLQQKRSTYYQSFYTNATDTAKNKVSPPNPSTQFPAATAVAGQ